MKSLIAIVLVFGSLFSKGYSAEHKHPETKAKGILVSELKSGKRYLILAHENHFLSLTSDNKLELKKNWSEAQFLMTTLADGRWSIQAPDRRYISARDDGTVTLVDNVSGWESFAMRSREVPDGKVFGFQSFHAERNLRAHLESKSLDLSDNFNDLAFFRFLEVAPTNQIVGTQAIDPLFGCKGECSVKDAAREVLAMGSRMIKVRANTTELQDILEMPFETYFFWWRSDSSSWIHGFSEDAQNAEYTETYNFAKKLLTQFKDQEKTFFLGHWEGDWYLLQLKDGGKFDEPTQETANNMAAWLNTRQRAVEDARRDVESRSKVFNYVEVNRVLDAFKENKMRVINAVVPQTNVDFISYSSYDVQDKSQEEVLATLDYMERQLKPKAGITSRRVFIGEMGVQARAVGYNPERHEQVNREIMLKFLKAKVPYVLYWQIYNNEVSNGRHEGFWLIDNEDRKWPLWHTLHNLYAHQRSQAASEGKSSDDFVRESTIAYLTR